MTVICKVYSQQRRLRRPFRFNSGVLTRKEIIQLVFYCENAPIFVWEIATSPSMGETAEFIRLAVQRGPQATIETSNSIMLRRACSYAKAALEGSLFPKTTGAGPRLTVRTKEAVETGSRCASAVLKFKANADSAMTLARWSHVCSDPFIVDFNGSLDESTWESFVCGVNEEKIHYLEQPFAKSHRKKIAGCEKIKVFADESAVEIPMHELAWMGYSGIVIKPMRYTHSEFTRSLKEAAEFSLHSVLGRMVGDIVESAHLNALSELCTIHIVNWSSPELEPLDNSLSNKPICASIATMDRIAHYVESNYNFIGALPTELSGKRSVF